MKNDEINIFISFQALLPGNAGDILGPRLVIKRAIEPNEVADSVLFLLSPLSAMITGEIVTIDGGIMAN